jgi:hypothetical protein
MNTNTNPPAFPFVAEDNTGMMINMGMTMRDYFAAKAMQAVFPKNWDMFMNETYDTPEEVVAGTASDAYELADAMMKARGK